MENNHKQCSSGGTDRKVVERNRRNEMKALYSRLSSLLPHQTSREAKTTLPDRLEDATEYIKELQANVEKLKEKRDKLIMGAENPRGKTACSGSKSRLPQVEVHQVGSAMEVVLITGSDYHFIFSQTLRLLQEEGAEIVNVNQSMFTDEVFHKIIAEVVGEGSDAPTISEKLNKFVSQYQDDGQHSTL